MSSLEKLSLVMWKYIDWLKKIIDEMMKNKCKIKVSCTIIQWAE